MLRKMREPLLIGVYQDAILCRDKAASKGIADGEDSDSAIDSPSRELGIFGSNWVGLRLAGAEGFGGGGGGGGGRNGMDNQTEKSKKSKETGGGAVWCHDETSVVDIIEEPVM